MYRILSPTAILGYGFPQDSFERAMACDLSLIAVDAGSMDAGPHYLGAQAQYVGLAALRRDLTWLIRGALQQDCPLIIGSAGFSGGDTQLRETAALIAQIVGHEGPADVRMAVVPSGVPPEAIDAVRGDLVPLGRMPALTQDVILGSETVGQMGMEPIIAALDHGAQIIVCGRAYDPAVFAADPIRQGYPAGVALHAAKILECGAIACEPGSGSDCLIAELTQDGVATFRATNPERRATVTSIAAHTLYEKSRPDLFHLPGGVLSIQHSHFDQTDESSVSIQGSRFIAAPYSIKLEGCHPAGHRVISILPLADCAGLDDILIYGRNGVSEAPVTGSDTELGIVVAATSADPTAAADALAFLRATMLHYGYVGRVATAGNLAFPFSPSDLYLPAPDGRSTALFIAGTRDPLFQRQLHEITAAVRSALVEQHPALAAQTEVLFVIGDGRQPLGVVETVHPEPSIARDQHEATVAELSKRVDPSRPSFCGIDVGTVFTWSIHHLLHDMATIKDLFPVELSRFTGGRWIPIDTVQPEYRSACVDLGDDALPDTDAARLMDDPVAVGVGGTPLMELAKVVRSKNAGINEITYDILFRTWEGYEAALASRLFGPANIAAVLDIEPDRLLGCYRYDPALAIKFTVQRSILCGSPGDRDAFGAQQHTRLLGLEIPRTESDCDTL
jgi:hypothetical protein